VPSDLPASRSSVRTGVAATAAAGVAGLGYAAAESRAFVLRRAHVPVLAAGQPSLRLLHLSDLHLTPTQWLKQRWVRQLAELRPDLVVVTGDFLAHRDAVPTALACLDGLLDVPGAFVLGSNDYYAPVVKNPLRYLLPAGQDRTRVGELLPWRALVHGLTSRGWADLSNRRAEVTVGDRRLAFTGVDDPHLDYDDLSAAGGPPPDDVDLAIAVAHAPYLRVLDRFTADGWPLLLAGHTHGGQVRVPGVGALVTNCDLDTERCRGLHQHTVADRTLWMHVSAGLGTSPYAPVRFACRPEATLLTLTPDRASGRLRVV
jgi:predicted MPP superfamily phosphohydrolase